MGTLPVLVSDGRTTAPDRGNGEGRGRSEGGRGCCLNEQSGLGARTRSEDAADCQAVHAMMRTPWRKAACFDIVTWLGQPPWVAQGYRGRAVSCDG